MIIVKLSGGLGNQMFQYASAKGVAKLNNDSLYIDISHYDKYYDRDYKLSNYNIKENLISKESLPIKFKILNNRLVNKFIRIFNIAIKGKDIYINQNDFGIYNCLLKPFKYRNLYLNGYWQNEVYFKEISAIIRKEFVLKDISNIKEMDIYKVIVNSNSISIHVRRGDYLTKNNKDLYGVCSLEYYKKSIEFMKKKVINPTFLVFSDDIEWAKENFNFKENFIFIDKELFDYEELYLMSKCKHNIIANSSFSWWAAWLNNNKEKIVVAPEKWTISLTQSQQIVPKSWNIV
ncbi:alpha-1,2-fucosyltransferase [Clostridium perfringens]|uniref:alpha-1,2-fucosyltransferase n=1 Tax=Clostridium perfringens TaxID=1502 RepID=UPI001CCCC531|nr:alpha-1,2-fucosyltransferase [Clostridium perfringens]UBK78245.1 alpha-1,2-fucosyltransferase [Clostridium perfringens]